MRTVCTLPQTARRRLCRRLGAGPCRGRPATPLKREVLHPRHRSSLGGVHAQCSDHMGGVMAAVGAPAVTVREGAVARCASARSALALSLVAPARRSDQSDHWHDARSSAAGPATCSQSARVERTRSSCSRGRGDSESPASLPAAARRRPGGAGPDRHWKARRATGPPTQACRLPGRTKPGASHGGASWAPQVQVEVRLAAGVVPRESESPVWPY